jgi:E3 ubiquitin-protein ligase BRE1
MLQARGSGLPEAEKADGQRLQMLSNQNSKLSAQLEVERKKIQDLNAKVSYLESKRTDYEQSLSCVNRIWDQLNKDIIFMARRAESVGENHDSASTSGQDHQTGNGISASALPDIDDPFLRRLVCADREATSFVADRCKELKDDATDVETALLQKSAVTKACLADLLERQARQEQRVAELFSHLGRDGGPSLDEEVRP